MPDGSVVADIQARIMELEEMLEGKQAAIDSLLQENEELRLQVPQASVSIIIFRKTSDAVCKKNVKYKFLNIFS